LKRRGFDADEIDAQGPGPLRTEPAPHTGRAIALIFASWVLPLWIFVSLFNSVEQEPMTRSLHTALVVTSMALLLVGMGLAIRAIDLSRKNPRMRRRLAVAGFLLAVATPVVWATELTLAWEVLLTRERLDAQADANAEAGDASSSPAE